MSIEGGPITQPPPRQFPQGTPPPAPQPQPEPTPSGTVIYDSRLHSTLHDKSGQTINSEGNLSGCGKGTECRASGSPKIKKETDGTFSLITGSGTFGSVSLRLRSRHNEGGDCKDRFGGYGFSFDLGTWESKRETCHNTHDLSAGGNLPSKLAVGTYFKASMSVKDESGKVRWTGSVNGQQVMNRLEARQDADPSQFTGRSYIWVRFNNADNGRFYTYVCNYNARMDIEAKIVNGTTLNIKSLVITAI